MSSPIIDPQAQLSDIEARLARIERRLSIVSAGALTLTLFVYATLPWIHLSVVYEA
ncbi:hypothetical protein [Microvirga sp. M2]|uniref:hypothetical protein n=1 Tax=Microvirga sp. M2 TaxID=3073270 RepID=UPI0039C49EA8